MLIAIGSTSPVKLQAITNVFLRAWPKVKFQNIKVSSVVCDQPIGEQETIKGAVHRAKTAQKKVQADFGVGIEGGVIKIEGQWYTQAWCAIVDKRGRVSLGGGAMMSLPYFVGQRLTKGEELGPIMDDWTGRSEVKKQEGAIGVLTKGLVDRTQAYENLVSFALAKFLNEKDYF